MPKLAFPGGALIGCAAGFVNLPRIKGSHNAMKTGMLGAEAAFAALSAGRQHDELVAYAEAFRAVVGLRGPLQGAKREAGPQWGMWAGTIHGGIHMWLNDLGLGALVPWTLRHDKPDNASLRPAAEMPRIDYPKYDGVLTFDKLSSVFVSNTSHEEDQPVHLQLRDPTVPVTINLARYDGPEERYCPAGVYEFVDAEAAINGSSGGPSKRLQINAATASTARPATSRIRCRTSTG